MAFNSNITAGRPPLLWSDVHEAFTKVNENFEILVATIGDGSGLTPLNFSSLTSDIIPTTDNLYNLGDGSHKWKTIHSAGWIEGGADAENGVWIGSAQIKGIGAHVDIPLNSTIGGSLIIDPDKTTFKTVAVDGQDDIVADTFTSTLTVEGDGIAITTDSLTNKLIFTTTAIRSVVSGNGISTSTVDGSVTVTNTGVRSLTSTTSLPSGRTAGAGINIDNSTGAGIKITNTGVLSVVGVGAGISVSTDAATGEVQIINSSPAQNSFSSVKINDDYDNIISADSVVDTLSINSGEGITLEKNTTTDTITISVNPVFDLKGSVFGDNSSKLVDAVESKVVGDIETDSLIVNSSGFINFNGANVLNGGTVEALILLAGNIGVTNDVEVQGTITGSVVGDLKGSVFGDDSSLLVDAVDNKIYASAGFYGDLTGDLISGQVNISSNRITGPEIEGVDDALAIYSNWSGNTGISVVSTTSFESVTIESDRIVAVTTNVGGTPRNWIFETTGALTLPAGGYISGDTQGTHTGNIFTSLIDSSDSTAITVTPATIFSSDVSVENELIVNGSRVINLDQLKLVVAASADFADFQTRIAALV